MRNREEQIKKKSMSLRTKLILAFSLVLLLPSLIIGLSSYQSASNNIDEQLHNSTEESLLIIDNTISNFINSQKENVNYIADASDVEGFLEEDSAEQRALLDTFQNTKIDVEQSYVGTEQGNFMNSPTSFQNPPDYDPRERPWYQTAMGSNGEVIITPPYISQSSNEPVTTLARTTEDGLGVAALNLKLSVITDMLNEISIGEKGFVFLLDQNNTVVSHPNVELGTESTDPLFETEDTRGQFDYAFDGQELSLNFLTNEETGWKIYAAMDKEEIAQASSSILFTTIIVMVLSLIVGAVVIFFILRSIVGPISKLTLAAERMSQGELNKEFYVHPSRNDEIGRLGNAFEKMRFALSTTLSSVQDKAQHLAASSEELSASTEENTRATEQISSEMQEMASGVDAQRESIKQGNLVSEEMASSVHTVSVRTEQVQKTASNATKFVDEGNEAIQTSIEQMTQIKDTVLELSSSVEGLGNSSDEISKVVDAIKSIAEQTNLLALNAAIEAARAGEQGKGFAVVAEQVRNLAEQSAESTQVISGIIQSIQLETAKTVKKMSESTSQVEKGIEVVNVAGKSFTEMKQFVEDVAKEVGEVASHAQSMASGTDQFVHTFKEISAISETTAASTENISASTEEQLASMEEISTSVGTLTLLAEELQNLVLQFDVAEAGEELEALSQKEEK
ncbi:methyl-accepting chemotaxis protein [Alkalicoccobacillus porphyridii]|uniref:Methyl-accepting chemotaxis protein n=1 Tax=Alkalicoccobacillus porphyridii TaxID=2597270 RepID=A0A553ZYU9_9BACI|nr:methyl-accepting chemotaxis protein [Alkalicoccobacillus porphyridii]TSB46612.1 methyl-accepting chemotaxis protein [Alkalicoccobacillus porphyridii]